jgi:hypothetical protein
MAMNLPVDADKVDTTYELDEEESVKGGTEPPPR